MALGVFEGLVGIGRWLASGLHATNRSRLPVLMSGILFASGRRTVTTWLRAAGISTDYPQSQ